MKSMIRFCYVALLLGMMVLLTGCGYLGWTSQNQPPQGQMVGQSNWMAVMQKVPHKFAIHTATTNYVIHAAGQDPQTSYMVLNHVLSQKLPSLEAWMHPELGQSGYGNSVRQVFASYGYELVREGFEDISYLPDGQEGKRRPQMAKAKLFKQFYRLNGVPVQPTVQPVPGTPTNAQISTPARGVRTPQATRRTVQPEVQRNIRVYPAGNSVPRTSTSTSNAVIR